MGRQRKFSLFNEMSHKKNILCAGALKITQVVVYLPL